MEETHQTLCKNLQQAQTSRTKHGGMKEVNFEVPDMVWPATQPFQTTRPANKLHSKRTTPYTDNKSLKTNADI
jgi:hypothetical protein